MGVLKAVVLLPLAPLGGVRWLARVLADEAAREWADQQSPERTFAELAAKRANGEISDEEADALEEQLIEEMLFRHKASGGHDDP